MAITRSTHHHIPIRVKNGFDAYCLFTDPQKSVERLPASIIVIIVTPTAVIPLLRAVPADGLRGERIHVHKRCLDEVSGRN